MKQFYLLIVTFLILGGTRTYATSPKAGGCRFYDNPKTDLGERSILRKLLTLGKRKDNNKVFVVRLKTYNVAPFVISLLLFSLTVVLYALYGLSFLFEFPVGVSIGSFLNSTIAWLIIIGWYFVFAVYVIVMHFL